MKLVNLIPLKEIDFRNQDAFDDYQKQHQLRPDTKVTIAGKVTTVGQAAQQSKDKSVKGTAVFGKDKGGKVFGNNKKSDDFSDIKGPKPNDKGWSTEDVFDATFKDPQTGKIITVGDAYDREDDSPAYKKAFAYVSQFDPDDEELISGPGSGDDLQKKADDVEALTSYKDFTNFFSDNFDKFDEEDLEYIQDEIGALKYLESDYEDGDVDRQELEVAYLELQDLFKKAMSKGDSSTSKSKPSDTKDFAADTKDFANVLPKGFSKYSDGKIDGVASFTNDAGNNIFVSAQDSGDYGVGVYNGDISNTDYKSAFIKALMDTNYKSFKDKQQAIEYVKQLAIKLSGSTKLSEMIPTKIKK